MEFKTTQSGETRLDFDPHEADELKTLGSSFGMSFMQASDALHKAKQANPLADFPELCGIVFATEPGPLKKLKFPRTDPLDDLEILVRRRISAAQSSGGPGATSQMQQIEATLLQALATVLAAKHVHRS